MKKIVLWLAMLGVCLGGCSSPKKEEKFVMKTVFSTDPLTLDPRKNSEVFSSFVQKMLFEGLTRLEADGTVSLGLADKVEVSEDGLTYRFHLRDAVWSDGHPITAHDLEHTWKQVLDPAFGAPCAFLFYPIQNAAESLKREVPLNQVGVRALNDKTFEVVLAHPTPYFLSLISFCPFFPIPKHIDTANSQWPQTTNSLVSSGPYQLVRWDHNHKIELRKNPSYWDRKGVALDGVEVLIVPDEKTVLRMFEQGEIDLVNSVTTPLSVDELTHWKGKAEMARLGGTTFCTFNLNHPMLKNPSIRKALSLAIDRGAIVKHITQMEEEPASRYLPTPIAKNPLTLMEEHNPTKARELFAEGMAELKKEGVPATSLTLCYENKEVPRRVAQALQHQWKQVLGFDVTLEENEFKKHVAGLEKRQYGMGIYSWWVHYLDPLSILERFKYTSSPKNYPGFNNSNYIALLDAAQRTNDPNQRVKLMEQAETVIVGEMPLTPIFHLNQVLLKSKRFQNVKPTPLGDVVFRTVKPAEKQ